MIRCLRTTRSARSRPASVRSASFFLPRSIRPSALEALQHLARPKRARRGASRPTREARGGEPAPCGVYSPIGNGEEVDRLEVLVHRVACGWHVAILPTSLRVRAPLHGQAPK